jgi:hypothetical protein
MIRYRYVADFTPPAPFVQVSVRCPTTDRQIQAVPAQIDPGADRTVLPQDLEKSLNLLEGGFLLFQGFGSQVMELPFYLATISIHDLQPVAVTAVLGEREPFILLGCDVLNAHRLVLDGPNLALEIG